MKRKKQLKIIISLLVMIAVLFGGWGLMKQEGLSAKIKDENETKSVRAVPTPPNANIVNVSDNFTIVGSGIPYPEWTNTVALTNETLQTGAVWYNEKISLQKDFEGIFYVYLGDFGAGASDGMTFALQNDPVGLKAVGGKGGALGLYGNTLYEGNPVKPAIAVEFDLHYNAIPPWDAGLELNDKRGHIATVISDTYRQDEEMPHYNVQYPESPLSDGQWRQMQVKWDSEQTTLEYMVSKFNETEDEWESLQGGMQKIVFGPTSSIPELRKTPEDFFEDSSVYWGFTGATGAAVHQIVALDAPFNQSQSPLQLSMTKLGEIGSDGVRQPLAGAKFILQAQNADGTWQQFNPEKATKDVAEVFTTGTDGKIVIKATDNQTHANLIDLVLKYGGLEDYQAFRFREVQAAPNPDPTGDAYLAPPAIDPNDPTNYAASEPENSAALFTTKSVKLSGASTTPTDPTTENPDDGDFGTVYNSNQPWLPYYKPGLGIGGGGWLDSMESYIPRSNAFVMQYLPGKTKLVDKSDGVLVGTHPQAAGRPNQAWAIQTDQSQYVKYENVGYYNGEMLTVKMTIAPNKPSGQDELLRSYIYFEGPYFLSSGVDSKCEGASLSFEFYNSAGKEVIVQSYVPILEQWDLWTTQVSSQDINNIYSVNRQYHYEEKSAPILIQYKENKQTNFLEFLGTVGRPQSSGAMGIQQRLTMTVNKFPVIKYEATELGKLNHALGFGLVNQTEVKVEIPDPQATSQIYTKIIDAGTGITDNQMIEPLNYGFIQQMPWESKSPKNNRTQIPTWTLPAPAGSTTFTQSDWQVQSQDDPDLGDGDVYDWFIATGNELTPAGGLEGKLADDDFYNHYYKFNRGLTIDYHNPITKDTLTAKDAGYYYDYSGNVDLDVEDDKATAEQEGMNKNREEVKYDTAINFLADDVQYKYLDQKIYDAQIAAGKLESDARAAAAINFSNLTWGTTPQPSGKGQAIVTWQVPLTPTTYTNENLADPGTPESATNKAPTIPGYEYVAGSAKLNGQTADYQVKVTKFLADDKTEADATAADYTKPNEVVLFYEPQGDVEIEDEDDEGVTTYLADDIDFGNITVPTASTITKAPEANNGTDKDQYPSLFVKDTRLKNYREAGWTLYVTMTEPFRLKKGDGTFDENETIDNILKYKNNFNFIKDGTATVPTELAITKGDKIPIESLIPTATQLNETIWRTQVDLGAQKEENGEASKGFYLEINKPTQLGIKAGEYQAELTFSVENSAFTTTPTP